LPEECVGASVGLCMPIGMVCVSTDSALRVPICYHLLGSVRTCIPLVWCLNDYTRLEGIEQRGLNGGRNHTGVAKINESIEQPTRFNMVSNLDIVVAVASFHHRKGEDRRKDEEEKLTVQH
jgi:hypothetical protein